MTLVNQALVIVTSFLLEDKTWAGRQISRQPIEPMSEILQGGETQRPFLAVYADNTRIDVDGRASNGISAMIDLKVNVHIAPGVTLTTDPESNEQTVELTLDQSTAGLTLDIMGRMVDHAFHIPGIWFDIYNRFVMSIEHRDIRYTLYETEDGVRVPTMEITYRVKTIPDPPHGATIANLKAWDALDAALRLRSAEGIALADLLKNLIEDGNGLPDYLAMQAQFGLTTGGLFTTGIAPAVAGVTDNDGETVPALDIAFDTEVAVVAPSED